jgi:hypothetical protein
VQLADGREIIAFLNTDPFEFSGDGIEFAGTVGLVIREQGKATAYPIRASALKSR